MTIVATTLVGEHELADSPARLAWSADGKWLAAGLTCGSVALIQTDAAVPVQHWDAHAGSLFSMAWHPTEALLATVGQDTRGRLWSLAHGCPEPVAELPTSSEWVEHVGWRSDGRQVAISAGRDVSVFSGAGDTAIRYTFPHSTIGAIAWHRKGAQLAVAGYNGLEIHNVLDPSSKPKRLPWRGSLLSLAWSPDGRVIAAGCQDNTVHFWRLREDRNSQMTGYETKPRVLAWSPNSRWLATSGSSDLTLWPFAGAGPEGRAPILLRRHRAQITALAFAPRGRMIASGCKAGQLCIWDTLDDFALPALVIGLDASIEDLAWHPDPRRLMLAGVTRYGTVSIFAIES